MIGDMENGRKQGIDEQAKQRAARNRVDARKTDITKEEKQAIIDKINQNKIIYYQQLEQKKAEQRLERYQVGLPEMRKKEALQEELQANGHQDQIFAGVKATERFRMGHEKENLHIAAKEHAFELPEKEKDQRILEAGNNPTPKEKDDLVKNLTKEEQVIRNAINSECKKVLHDKSIPLDKRGQIAFGIINKYKKRVSHPKLKNKKQQINRGKHIMKGVDPDVRRDLEKLEKEKTKMIARNMGRCA